MKPMTMRELNYLRSALGLGPLPPEQPADTRGMEVQRALVKLLSDGRVRWLNEISKVVDRTRPQVCKALGKLERRGRVVRKARGRWSISSAEA